MENRTFSFVLMLALGAAGAVPAASNENRTKKLEDQIVAVDTENQTFSVESDTGELTFHVGVGINVNIDGRPKRSSALETGEHVTVTYKSQGLENIPLRKGLMLIGSEMATSVVIPDHDGSVQKRSGSKVGRYTPSS